MNQMYVNRNRTCMLLEKFVDLLVKRRRVMSTFVSRTNPVTGKLDWMVQNEDYDFQQEVARQVIGSWYPM